MAHMRRHNCKVRPEYALKYLKKFLVMWAITIWSDETKREWFGLTAKKEGSDKTHTCLPVSGSGDFDRLQGTMNRAQCIDVSEENPFNS